MKVRTPLILIAASSTPAFAMDVIPLHHVDSIDVNPSSVAVTAGSQTWQVTHGCDLSLTDASEVQVRPAHKNVTMPHRMNRLGESDSLVITVNGHSQTCAIDTIKTIDGSLAVN
jgi:hypothetical protein